MLTEIAIGSMPITAKPAESRPLVWRLDFFHPAGRRGTRGKLLTATAAKLAKCAGKSARMLVIPPGRKPALYVPSPPKYYHRSHPGGDSYSTAQLTRFFPPSLFRLFERVVSAPPKPADKTLPNAAGETAQHVRARLK